MKKGRLEADFKKKMTERSDFSASVGIKKAKKVIKESMKEDTQPSVPNCSLDRSKYTSFGKVDGA